MERTENSAFGAVGGADAVRALIDRFYDLMDLEPGYVGIRQHRELDVQQGRV
jgi:hemoglobin